MAIMHPHTTLVPSKLEILAGWLPTQPWFMGDAHQLARVGEYRLDDPEGEVGLNGILVTAGDDTVYHVPLTYRNAPLDAGEEFLLGTMEHGVLGTRWVTFGPGDPVYRHVLASTIAQCGSGAEEFVTTADGAVSAREIAVPLRGSGEPGATVPEMWAVDVTTDAVSTLVDTGFITLRVIHVPGADAVKSLVRGPVETLTARWAGQEAPLVIAALG